MAKNENVWSHVYCMSCGSDACQLCNICRCAYYCSNTCRENDQEEHAPDCSRWRELLRPPEQIQQPAFDIVIKHPLPFSLLCKLAQTCKELHKRCLQSGVHDQRSLAFFSNDNLFVVQTLVSRRSLPSARGWTQVQRGTLYRKPRSVWLDCIQYGISFYMTYCFVAHIAVYHKSSYEGSTHRYYRPILFGANSEIMMALFQYKHQERFSFLRLGFGHKISTIARGLVAYDHTSEDLLEEWEAVLSCFSRGGQSSRDVSKAMEILQDKRLSSNVIEKLTASLIHIRMSARAEHDLSQDDSPIC